MAIQWVLRNQDVSTAIVGMPTFDELEENYHAASTPAMRAEMEEFEAAVATVAMGSCHLCGACTGQCPAGVKVARIMRYLLYHDGYADRERAAALYRELPSGGSAAACATCERCRPVCPWGVPVRARMRRAHSVLAQGPRSDDVACHHGHSVG
jgi:predicted aldo/keto reductase-like oxidoreductase